MLGKDTPAHQSLHCQINISLGHLLHVLRNVLQVAQEASGWIRFVLTTISHRLIYGDVLSVEVILGSRNGPSRLLDNDDDPQNGKRGSKTVDNYKKFQIIWHQYML